MGVLLSLALLLGVSTEPVMRGPTAPVCRVGVPCSAPAAGARLVFVRHHQVVAHVRIGKNGGYTVRLAPGVYTVVVRPSRRIGIGIRPHRVRVFSGPPRELNFWIDTGIR